MDVTISVFKGSLFLANFSDVFYDEALEGDTLNFRGSKYAVNNALSWLVYQV